MWICCYSDRHFSLLGAFAVVWFNEGRVDLSVIAARSIALTGDQYLPENEGELVAVSDRITSSELLGDPPFLQPQSAIQLNRKAEMYAWSESGSEEDGYSYNKVWTENPANSDSFEFRQGHENPPMRVTSEQFVVSDAEIGRFELNTNDIFFRQLEPLTINEGMLAGSGTLFGNTIYFGEGSATEPRIGDIRLTYDVFPANRFSTVFGQQSETRIITYREDETLLYRAYPTDREGGIAALRTEYVTALWGTRIGGLFMFWFGLLMILAPIRQIMGSIPLLGKAGNFVIGLVTFAVAFVVWLVTLIIAIILHNLIALLIVLLLVGGVGYFFWSQQQKEKGPQPI